MTRRWRRAAAWLAVLAPFFYATYGLANHLAAQRAHVPTVVFDWERQIPFWAWTIFPYWTINVFYGLSLFLARDRHELDRHGARLLSAQVIAVSFFIACPLAFSFGQPAVSGAPAWLFDALRSFDRPFNQAPSLHIALAVILWDLYRRLIHARWARLVLHVWAFAICASVLTTWQHHFIDIPTGALLGLLCVWAWPLERRVAPWRAWRLTHDPARRRLAWRYALGASASAALAAGLGGAALWLFWPTASLALVALCYLGLGVRGFQTDAAGRMGWAARWLFAPYRAGAWINARLWTRRLRLVHEVLPGITIGRLPGRAEWAGLHTDTGPARALVSLCPELQSPDPAHTRCVPMLDLAPSPAPVLRRAAAAIERMHRQHGAVHVCCALGFSRSAAALACWLLRSGRARSPADAARLIAAARPQVVLHAGWMRAIEEAASGDAGRGGVPAPRPPGLAAEVAAGHGAEGTP